MKSADCSPSLLALRSTASVYLEIHGIMQNLTVIPLVDVDPDATIGQEEEKYVTLIGHRRYAAGSQAGVTEFPCKIARGLSEREQMSIMLEELSESYPLF